MTRTIILGYDGSDCAATALQRAIDEAKLSADSRIIVVHAERLPAPYHDRHTSSVAHTDDEIDGELALMTRRIEQATRPMLDRAVERITEAGVPAESRLEWGDPTHALLHAASGADAALIVVGTHGEGGVTGVLRGSVAYKLLRHAQVPLLIVPPAGDSSHK
jgi:nucleotide-binding universal stress UspA family protein